MLMKAFIEKVRRTIARHRMLEDGMRVIVAVSGGPDSVALLCVLHRLKQQCYPALSLHVAHLNHQLRGSESDEDEAFVQALAAQLGLPCACTRLDIKALARQQKRNCEEVAREQRYAFLRRLAADTAAHRIATGHTMTDQAETVLMRLVRGAGADGLSAIWPVVDDLIIRPLLGVTREEVLNYCEQTGVTYRLDPTNLDLNRSRNRIRHDIMPSLSDLNPRVAESLARAAQQARCDEDYFAQLVRQVMPACLASSRPDSLSLNVAELQNLPAAVRRRVLRTAIGQFKGHMRGITAWHVEALEQLCQAGMSGRRLQLPGLVVWREFDRLTLRRPELPSPPMMQPLIVGQTAHWGSSRLTLHRALPRAVEASTPNAALLDDEALPTHLFIRARKPGDRYVPVGHRQPEKVKRLMQEHHVPVSQRAHWPLVVSGVDDSIVWTPWLPVAAPFAPTACTKRFALITIEPVE